MKNAALLMAILLLTNMWLALRFLFRAIWFPGANRNTFTAWTTDEVPDLGLNFPFSAIGSGYADCGATKLS
jgi:hypothetical protein